MLQELHESAAAENDLQQGFYLEHVLQACPAPERDAAPLPGPHVLEIVLKGASLHWPYLARLDFVMAVAETYNHCFTRPWAAPNPPVRLPSVLELSCGSCQLNAQFSAVFAHCQSSPYFDSKCLALRPIHCTVSTLHGAVLGMCSDLCLGKQCHFSIA